MAHHCRVRRDPATPASGHFTGTPARSLHARGAGAPRRYFRLPALGGITRFAQRASGPFPAPAARGPSPRPLRADGDARRAEATASMIGAGPAGGQRTIPECAVNPGTSAGGHFTGIVVRRRDRRRAEERRDGR